MKKFFILVLVMFLSRCATTTLAPGLLFSYTTEHIPLYDSITLGAGRVLYKEESCSYNSIFVSAFYKGELLNPHNLAKSRGITKIGVIDYSSLNILGFLFYRRCIIIWGDKE